MYNRKSWIKGNTLRRRRISERTVTVLAGTLLGDGHLAKTSSGKRFLSLHHGAKQLEFLLWKARQMPELFIEPLPIQYRPETNSYQVRSICRDDLEPYADGEFLLSKLTVEGLAVYFGDNGWISQKDKNLYIDIGSRFDEHIRVLMIDRIRELGVKCSLARKGGGKYWRIYLYREETQKLCSNFLGILPSCLHYKLTLNGNGNHTGGGE